MKNIDNYLKKFSVIGKIYFNTFFLNLKNNHFNKNNNQEFLTNLTNIMCNFIIL